MIKVNQSAGRGKIGDTFLVEPALFALGERAQESVLFSVEGRLHDLFKDHPWVIPVTEIFDKPDHTVSVSEAFGKGVAIGLNMCAGFFHQVGLEILDARISPKYYCNDRDIKFSNSTIFAPYGYSCASRDGATGLPKTVKDHDSRPTVQPPMEWWDELLPKIPGEKYVFCGTDENWDWPHFFPKTSCIRGKDIASTFAAMKAAKCIIVVNTGQAHMAAASGTPTIFLTGPSSFFAPKEAHLIMAPNYMDELSIDQVVLSHNSILHAKKNANLNIGLGELVDRLSILKVKSEKIKDPIKLSWVLKEIMEVDKEYRRVLNNRADDILEHLFNVNCEIWEATEELRQEFDKDIGKATFGLNDVRAALKRRVDVEFGSVFSEQKSFDIGGE